VRAKRNTRPKTLFAPAATDAFDHALRYEVRAAVQYHSTDPLAGQGVVMREHAVQSVTQNSIEVEFVEATDRPTTSSMVAVGVLALGGVITVGWVGLLAFAAGRLLLYALTHL